MTERARYWSAQVASWQRSGLSQTAFCQREGINYGTFGWWKRHLQKRSGQQSRRRGRAPKSSGPFVEVRLSGSPSAYEVVLTGGRSIRVPSQFDLQVLSRLITAVESC